MIECPQDVWDYIKEALKEYAEYEDDYANTALVKMLETEQE